MVAHYVTVYIARTTDDEDVHRPRDYLVPLVPLVPRLREEPFGGAQFIT